MINFDRAGDGRLHVCRALGCVYTKRQRQTCDDACDSVLIENSGVASKWIRLQTDSRVTPLFSMRTELLASWQSCRSFDADAWCKRALKPTCEFHPQSYALRHLDKCLELHLRRVSQL